MAQITVNENKLRSLISESIRNILSEGLFEADKEDKPKKKKKSTGLASQAKAALSDEKLNNAEIARQLEDAGFLSGDEDTDRSYISKIKRGERKMPPGVPAALMNIISND